MATTRKRREKKRSERKRAGSSKRDAWHKVGGDWTSLTLPEGVDLWQPKEGSHRIDIVPYEVGDGNPCAERGEWYYERTYWAHRGIGPNNATYVCAAKSADRPCPVCDYMAKLSRDEANRDIVDALRPKERQLWLVHDRAQEDKGVQLWDFSHYNFGRLLDKIRQDADEDEVHISDFDDPEAGAQLKVSFSEEKGGGYTYLEAYSIEFRPRPNGLDESLLEHDICLDDVLKIEDYDKLKAVLLQVEGEPEEEEDEEDDEPEPERSRPVKRPRRKPEPEPEEDDWLDGDGDEEEPEEGGEGEKEPEPEKEKKRGRPKGSKNKPKPKPEPESEPEPGPAESEPDEGDDDWDNWDDEEDV